MNRPDTGGGRILEFVSAAPRYCVGALMIVVTILVNVEVALRFFLDLPLDALSEIVLLLFPWLSMVGAAVAFDTVGANVALHLLGGHLTARARARMAVFVSFTALGFGVFLIFQGTNYALMTRNELTNTLEISRSWDIVAFPICGALIVAYSLRSIWMLLRRKVDTSPDVASSQF